MTNLVKCYCPRCIVGVHDDIQLATQYRKHAEWKERAEKAEAEVERLTKLFSAIQRARASLNAALDKTLSDLRASKAEVEKLDKERRQLSRELHLWEMGMYHKPKMQAKINELRAEVERLKDE